MIKKEDEKDHPLGKMFITIIAMIVISFISVLLHLTHEMAKSEEEKKIVQEQLMMIECAELGGTVEIIKLSKTTVIRCSYGSIGSIFY